MLTYSCHQLPSDRRAITECLLDEIKSTTPTKNLICSPNAPNERENSQLSPQMDGEAEHERLCDLKPGHYNVGGERMRKRCYVSFAVRRLAQSKEECEDVARDATLTYASQIMISHLHVSMISLTRSGPR